MPRQHPSTPSSILLIFFTSLSLTLSLTLEKIPSEIETMVSKSKFRKSHEELGSDAMANLAIKLTQLKRQIHSERVVSVGEKLEKNIRTVQEYASHFKELAASRTDCTVAGSDNSGSLLSLRMNYPLCKVSGLMQGSDRDEANSEEVVFTTTAKLPLVQRIPPYTTWIFLDRNQKMADDQSVVGRRRIYYDQHGSEALVCSDSEEELVQLEGVKHEFSEGEDRVMRAAVQECGVANEVLDTLTQFVGGTSLEIQERCNMFMEKDQPIGKKNLKSSREEESDVNVLLEKTLAAALDSFDNLFCRHCLVFDCRMHGCSQNLIYPNEKQPYPFDPEDDRKPCGDQCYLKLNGLKNFPKNSAVDPLDGHKVSDEEGFPLPPYAIEQAHHPESKGRHIILEPTNSLANTSNLVFDDLPSSSSKKLKLANPNPPDHITTLVEQFPKLGAPHEYELERDAVRDKGKDISELPLKQACNFMGKSVKASHGWNDWKPFERELYLKGLEIFGRNSCFIARNLLPGLKTCKEVSTYMYGDGAVMSRGSSSMLSSGFEDVGKADMDRMVCSLCLSLPEKRLYVIMSHAC